MVAWRDDAKLRLVCKVCDVTIVDPRLTVLWQHVAQHRGQDVRLSAGVPGRLVLSAQRVVVASPAPDPRAHL